MASCQTAFCFGFLIVWGMQLPKPANGQEWDRPGRPIGKVTTKGDLIVLELEQGVLGKANLFNLVGRTLRFTPGPTGYRLENSAITWDPEFGNELKAPVVTLHNFAFPYSGKKWKSLFVDTTGAITFPAEQAPHGSGIPIGRFDQVAEAASRLVNTVPAICVFLKPRMKGTAYLKELRDRIVVTWDVTEPAGNIQDFTWVPTINRFQAVLLRDGTIEMSYDQVAARDAIVGVYPLIASGAERPLATLDAEEDAAATPHADVRKVRISVIDNMFVRASFETQGPIPAEGSERVAGVTYSLRFSYPGGPGMKADSAEAEAVWSIRRFDREQDGDEASRQSRYRALGPGVGRRVEVAGNSISMQGILPPALRRAGKLRVRAEVKSDEDSDVAITHFGPHLVTVPNLQDPEVDFASPTRRDGAFKIAFEAFHYLALPHPQDMACSVIKTLGDKFDFLAYYSDFRIDNQEAGTPSDGPLGGNVTGIGQVQHGLETYCSSGRFQWQFIQPIYVGSNQMQEYPPEGVNTGSDRNIDFYERQLGERSLDGKMLPYNYAMSQIAHEMGHRWAAFVSAKLNGAVIPLGPVHWARGLQAPVAFPYQRPTEASIMGGGVWQDNFDGTFTQLDDNYYVPATGDSYLDLYLMGLIAPSEVPEFFLLRNLVQTGTDANQHPIFKADRIKVTIQDVIAAEGPRLPPVHRSQRKFNTGMVMVVEHGANPSRDLIERTGGIRKQWIEYWNTVTGGRSSMTADPK